MKTRRHPRWITAATLGLLAVAVWPALSRTPLVTRDALKPLGSAALCAVYPGLPQGWGQDRHAGMVRVKGGDFQLGSDDGYQEERPVRTVRVEDYWIDRTEVTNQQFSDFVSQTGYVTEAERTGGGFVFIPVAVKQSVADGAWWHFVKGADWRHPEGPGSDSRSLGSHPVVQVTRADALAYAKWLDRQLPTERQWEYAAKANGQGERIERGPRDQRGQPSANFWQGHFPYVDVAEDGHKGRSPAGCYPANGWGLHDVIGNVWEWTRDPWSGSHQAHGTGSAGHGISGQPIGLIKGGSFLCSTDYCVRYRSSARHPQEVDVPTSHVGFRTSTTN